MELEQKRRREAEEQKDDVDGGGLSKGGVHVREHAKVDNKELRDQDAG